MWGSQKLRFPSESDALCDANDRPVEGQIQQFVHVEAVAF